MKIEFNFSLKIDGKESLSRFVEYETNLDRAESLAVQIIKQLEFAKLNAEFEDLNLNLGGISSAS